jgi:hypothetical protein
MSWIRRSAGWLTAMLLVAQGAAASAPAIAGIRSMVTGVDVECCVPGSHPPGMCPLHRKSPARPAEGDRTCRFSCAPALQAPVMPLVGVTFGPSWRFVAPAPVVGDLVALVSTPIELNSDPSLPPPKA